MRWRLIGILVFMSLHVLRAQDIQFTQSNAGILQLNPSFAGIFAGDIRVNALYKVQFPDPSFSFRTFAVSIDGFVSRRGTNYFAAGLRLLADEAGELNYNYQQFAAIGTYTFSISKAPFQNLSFGLELSAFRHATDYQQIRAYDTEPTIGAINNRDQSLTPDIAIGANYTLQTDKSDQSTKIRSLFAAVAVHHLAFTDVSFLSEDGGYSDFIFPRISLIAGGEYKYSIDRHILMSSQYYRQGPHQSLSLTTGLKMIKMQLPNGDKGNVYFGTNIVTSLNTLFSNSFNLGLSALFRLEYFNRNIGFSYDFNISDLARVSNGFGGPEISYTHLIRRGKEDAFNKRVYNTPL